VFRISLLGRTTYVVSDAAIVATMLSRGPHYVPKSSDPYTVFDVVRNVGVFHGGFDLVVCASSVGTEHELAASVQDVYTLCFSVSLHATPMTVSEQAVAA
jgi:hypothetical protein